jgi:hypothetical protein
MRSQFQPEGSEWDQLIVIRLYKYYENIIWSHKVKLRSVAIRLMDSNTHWGTWDSENRTIWISRKLIQNSPWFCVESILRHEMAHQYCSEFLQSNERPHGDLFKKACERLGVPREFRGATVSLQETPLDWKTLKQDDESERLFNKVQKLLALATSSNEHEALLAMNKVREIYAKYNLDKYFGGDHEKSKDNMAHIFICHKKKRIEAHQDKIAGILVGHFFVKVLFSREFDSKTLQEYKAIQLIGTRENVLMAEYVYHFLLQQTDFLVRELKKQKQSLTRLEAKSYRLGVLQGFSDKLVQMDKLLKRSSQMLGVKDRAIETDAAVFENALAVMDSDKSLTDYVATVFPRLVNASSHAQYIDPSIYSQGKVAGERLTLHKAVSDKKGNSGLLLT